MSYEPRVLQVNQLELWTESFGNKENPALILIMGSGGQGILWPQAFCEQLASGGYYVIRYDHRDTGLSSSINYHQTPYTLMDMTQDVVAILDQYSLPKAHVVGASMGGLIAMLLAAHHADRVASLALMMTTIDMRPCFDAFQGQKSSSSLSAPTEAVLAAAKNAVTPPKTLDEKVDFFMANLKINSGDKVSLDLDACRQLALQVFARMKNPEGVANHFQAILASYDSYSQAPKAIKAPTLILHGDSDPIFPLDHAYATQEAIPHSRLEIIPGLGHGFCSESQFASIVEKIAAVAQ
jgi:pimeloyl-ACP methyl ester carboxylesterase